jgi:hypothetical protein
MTIETLLLLVSLIAHQPTSPLISYQAMEELKGKLAEVTVEVEAVLQVPDGADASIAPVMVGQGVCVADEMGKLRLVTSAFLVQNSSRLRVRTKAAPEWAAARLVRLDEDVGLAELVTSAEAKNFCQAVAPATPLLEGAGGLVFSIDNPTTWTSIFHGNLVGRAEPPLVKYLLAASGLPLGGPLYGPTGDFAALNLRRYVQNGEFYLAAPATMVLQWIWGTRRDGEPNGRRQRRPPISRSAVSE